MTEGRTGGAGPRDGKPADSTGQDPFVADGRAPSVLDLRLAMPAIGAWAATAAVLVTGRTVGTMIAAGSLLAAIVGWVFIRRRGTGPVGRTAAGRRRAPRAGRLSPVRVAAVVTFGVAGCFGLVGVLRVVEVESHPVRAAAERGQYATVEATVTDDPRLLTGGLPTVLVQLDGSRARIGNNEIRAGFSAVAFTPERGWLGLLPGQEVVVRARLAVPDRADLTVARLVVTGPPMEVRDPPGYQRWASGLRAGLVSAAERALPSDAAGLLPALVVGDVSGLDEDLVADFRAAGLTHLTAVSGANFTLVVGSALALARATSLGPRPAAAIAGVVLVAFAIIARPSPSVLRAAVMSAVALLALVTARRKQAMPALAAAVLGLLAWQPALAVAPGFALSVAATGALIVIAPILVAYLERLLPKLLAEAVAVAVAAHLGTMPILMALGSPVGVIAMLANLLVAPVIAPITVLGAVAAVVMPITETGAEIAARATGPPLAWLIGVARWCAQRV